MSCRLLGVDKKPLIAMEPLSFLASEAIEVESRGGWLSWNDSPWA